MAKTFNDRFGRVISLPSFPWFLFRCFIVLTP
jgi:hypothetical protein